MEIREGFIKKDVCELDPERWAQTDEKERTLSQGNSIGKAKMLGLGQKVHPGNRDGADWRETSRKKATGADRKT